YYRRPVGHLGSRFITAPNCPQTEDLTETRDLPKQEILKPLYSSHFLLILPLPSKSYYKYLHLSTQCIPYPATSTMPPRRRSARAGSLASGSRRGNSGGIRKN